MKQLETQVKGQKMTYCVVAKESKELLAIVDSLEEAIEEKKYAWNKQGIDSFIVNIDKSNEMCFE